MTFDGEGGPIYRPCVPVTFGFDKRTFRVGSALIDTGADMTVLPMDVARVLGIALSEADDVRIGSAGGGRFLAMRSEHRIEQSIERVGFRPCRWKGYVYFAPRRADAGRPDEYRGSHQRYNHWSGMRGTAPQFIQ